MKNLKKKLFKNYNEQLNILDKQLELLNLLDKELEKQLTLTDVVGQSEQYCDDNEVTHNRYRLTDGFAYCPDCGQEL